jgi:hypothetical protein
LILFLHYNYLPLLASNPETPPLEEGDDLASNPEAPLLEDGDDL